MIATEKRVRAIVAASGGRWGDGDAMRLLGLLEHVTEADAKQAVAAAYATEAEPVEACDECKGFGIVAREAGDGSPYEAPCPRCSPQR